MVEDMVETYCLLIEDFLDQVLPHIDFDFAGLGRYLLQQRVSRIGRFLQECCCPKIQADKQKLRAAGIDLWYTDCDGDIRALLPHFLEGGINCMFPFEVNGCSHPAELLNEYGKELRIMGGGQNETHRRQGSNKSYLETLVRW